LFESYYANPNGDADKFPFRMSFQQFDQSPYLDEQTQACIALWAAVIELARSDILETKRVRPVWAFVRHIEEHERSAKAFLSTLVAGDPVFECCLLLGKIK